MIDFLMNKISGKKLLVLGFGREGESTFRFLEKYFPEIKVTVADVNGNILDKLNRKDINVLTGKDYLNSIKEYDMVFKTPGISLNHLSFTFEKKTITSQTDLFLDFYDKQVIGVTGTKGKSTTSSLIYHIIKLYTNDVVFVGNIGIPPFDLIEEIKPSSRIVFELSSHQLEYIHKSPHISVLLNIFQEHLDHFKNFGDYKLSKLNIAEYQDSCDYFIYNADDNNTCDLISSEKSGKKNFVFSLKKISQNGCFVSGDTIFYRDDKNEFPVYDLKLERKLKGDHNIQNIMAAVCACKISEIPDKYITEGINSFKGLEHRMEYVGKYEGIDFYNDSIATIPEATIEALKTLKTVETLILGGYDRGIDYSLFAKYLSGSAVKNILFLGKAGERIFSLLNQLDHGNKKLIITENLDKAVQIAKEKTSMNGICLLSPAAASYDSFKNFEERGEMYKKIVSGFL
ncbi:MAG: UDP-N-acetylmuramoyl-L-alanine--D-glutamate ligase [Bacteroidota bacterium]